jgi:hypothetical protein
MIDFIEPRSRVIEYGCGKGDLLIQLSSKIQFGLGIDKSKTLIDYAIKEKEKMNISNVDFMCKELRPDYKHSDTYDFSMASLFFHVIPVSEAVYLLGKMREISDTVLICGLSRPNTPDQRFSMWLDQRFSSHYKNFKAYQMHGYFEGILPETDHSHMVTYDTHIPFIKIYKIN